VCNAWNHPPDCTCGWGGAGHSGRSTDSSNWRVYIPIIQYAIQSFTVPNAKCPVCGEIVFYYWNAFGSSVFFDELGPPWPKHPCTDNSNRYTPQPFDTREAKKTSCPWEKDGWEIFKINTVRPIDRYSIRVIGKNITKNCELTFCMEKEKRFCPKSKRLLFHTRSLAFIKARSGNKYILSFLDDSFNPYDIEVYRTLYALRDAQVSPQTKSLSDDRKKSSSKIKSKKKHKKIRTHSERISKEKLNKLEKKSKTEIEIAFDKAKKKKE